MPVLTGQSGGSDFVSVRPYTIRQLLLTDGVTIVPVFMRLEVSSPFALTLNRKTGRDGVVRYSHQGIRPDGQTVSISGLVTSEQLMTLMRWIQERELLSVADPFAGYEVTGRIVASLSTETPLRQDGRLLNPVAFSVQTETIASQSGI